MMYVLEFGIAMLATISFAVLFTAPKKEVIYCGITGALGWIVYYTMTQNGLNLVFASMVATFCLTVLARCFAVVRKTPVTVYLLSGIFPLVPGAGIYYTAYYLFMGNTEMSGFKGLETLEVAGAIVFGIIFGFGIPQALFHKLSPKKLILTKNPNNKKPANLAGFTNLLYEFCSAIFCANSSRYSQRSIFSIRSVSFSSFS